MIEFLNDRNRWVKIESFKSLGEFIITLEHVKVESKIFDTLVEYYSHMV